jgi:CheY-like chemotaxis protein
MTPVKRTVLLVDDEGGLRRVLGIVLRNAGYEVLEAADGHEALRLAEAHAGVLDLLAADVRLPGMGGPELAARLLTLRPGLKVLLLSGDDVPAGAPGGVAFLGKPFAPDALVAKVGEVLGG